MNNDVESFLDSYAYKKIDLIKNADFLDQVANMPVSKKHIYKYLLAQGKINCSYPYFSYLLRKLKQEKRTPKKESESESKVATNTKVESKTYDSENKKTNTNIKEIKKDPKKEIIPKPQEKVPFSYDPTEDIQIF